MGLPLILFRHERALKGESVVGWVTRLFYNAAAKPLIFWSGESVEEDYCSSCESEMDVVLSYSRLQTPYGSGAQAGLTSIVASQPEIRYRDALREKFATLVSALEYDVSASLAYPILLVNSTGTPVEDEDLNGLHKATLEAFERVRRMERSIDAALAGIAENRVKIEEIKRELGVADR